MRNATNRRDAASGSVRRCSARACERRRAGRAAALLEVLLVVVLGLVEGRRRLDLRHDRRAPVRLLARLRAQRELLLLLVVEEDDRAVLVADVPSLAVELRRIVLVPEDVEQLFVSDELRVEGHFDDLGMPGRVRADIFVRRILERATGVTDARPGDAFDLAKRRLDAPEATGAERCLLL